MNAVPLFISAVQKLAEETQDYFEPIFIINEKCVIAAKNKFAVNNRISLKLGASLKRYTCAADYKKILALEDGHLALVTLKSQKLYSASVIRRGNNYIVRIRDISTVIYNRISSIMRENCISLDELYDNAGNSQKHFDTSNSQLLNQTKMKSARMIEHIKQIVSLISFTKEANISCVNINAFIERLVKSTEAAQVSSGIRISSECSFRSGMVCVNGMDLCTEILLMVVFGAKYCNDKKIKLKIDKASDWFYISLTCETLLSPEVIEQLANDEDGYPIDTEYGELFLSAFLCKRLARFYGWKLNIGFAGAGTSFVRVALSIPEAKDNGELALFSPKAGEDAMLEKAYLEFSIM